MREKIAHPDWDQARLQVLGEYARAAPADGDLAEVGVYRGVTAALLRRELPGRRLFLIDALAALDEIADRRFAFVHVGALFLFVKECLEFFSPRMVGGGLVVLDEYTRPVAKLATDEWAAESGIHPIWLPTGQAVIRFH